MAASMEQNYFTFQISNPYDKNHVSAKGTGFGLGAVQRRLYLLYARNDLLIIEKENEDEGETGQFLVKLKLPMSVSQTNELE